MLSSNVKYIGLDVHKEAITVAVRNAEGKLVMESIVETKASTLLRARRSIAGAIASSGCRKLTRPGYTAAQNCSISSWMDCKPYGAQCEESFFF
jgi:hypothetical protein